MMLTGRRMQWGALAMLALFSLPAAAQTVFKVSIEAYRFTPPQINIRAGDSVMWRNQEKRTSHSVVFPAEGGLESERLFPGESWQRRFDQPGRYEYQCGPHPEMKGLILVAD